MKSDQYIQHLYSKYLNNEITGIELQELFELLDQDQQSDQLKQLIRKTMEQESEPVFDQRVDELLRGVKDNLRTRLRPVKTKKLNWGIYASAAAILIAMGIGLFLLRENSDPKSKTTLNDNYAQVIRPGGSRAILTLSNGKKIELNDKQEILYSENGVEIKQDKDGSILYSIKENTNDLAAMNRIEVPKGGQYKVKLPDGTQVWLNSESSLRYPAAFGKMSRTMEMTGEAFFDIAPNKNFPFKVIAGKQEVTALGTSFNINAYNNEPGITTTLLEGKLKVEDKQTTKRVIILPGQQTASQNGDLKITQVNASDVIAWKDGLFVVNKSSLGTVMRQLERWYDVEVDVKLPNGTGTYSGELPRNVPLKELLESFETVTGLKLKLEGRRVTNR